MRIYICVSYTIFLSHSGVFSVRVSSFLCLFYHSKKPSLGVLEVREVVTTYYMTYNFLVSLLHILFYHSLSPLTLADLTTPPPPPPRNNYSI